MKKNITLFLALLVCTHLLAQAPQKMSYQAVVRDSNNALLVSTAIGMQISLLQGSVTGSAVYVETHTTTTNTNGFISLEIGTGTAVIGSFSAINWANGPYFIKTESDVTGGTSYSISGTSELLSVPYALFAAQSTLPPGNAVGDIQYWNGTAWVLLPVGTSGQVLKVSPSNVPQWAASSEAVPMATIATDAVSEIFTQEATFAGTVSNGGGEMILSRGFCYSTNANPTINDALISSPGGLGAFSEHASALVANTNYHLRAFATTIAGTVYGSDLSFTTLSGIPALTTTPVTNIQECFATSGGTVTDFGGAANTSYGVCYGTNPNPTVNDENSSSSENPFTLVLNTNSANTLYYYRAYATNETGTYYGNELTFTSAANSVSITTFPASAINSCNATITATITGPNTNITKGICYSTSPNPTLNDPTYNGDTDTIIAPLTFLTPNTLYYARGYTSGCWGATYGNQISFTTTAGLATVNTSSASLITSCSVKFTGTVTANDGGTLDYSGLCYATTPNPTVANTVIPYYTNAGTLSNFTSTIYNLSSNTNYYVRAYTSNCAGIFYGNEVVFSTLKIITSITTNPMGTVTAGTAVCNATIIGNNVDYTNSGFCYSTNPNPTIADNYQNLSSGNAAQIYSTTILGLTANTTYYLRSINLANACGEILTYGNQIVFTTPASTTLVLGQNYGGGLIFWLDATATGGLIAASSDQGTTNWGCEGTTISGTSASQGTGQANTNSIVTGCANAGIAAKTCADLVLNGQSDWYLPSEAELILVGQLYYFPVGNYWTSTQASATQAKYVNGIISATANKATTDVKVRAIRSF